MLATVLAGILAFAITSTRTATYSATTTVLVNPQQIIAGADNTQLLQASQAQAGTFVLLVESGPVLDRVIANLGLDYTREELADKIEARVILNTQIIEISVSNDSAEEAARIANGVASEFDAYVEELTIGNLQDRLDDSKNEIAALRARQADIDDRLEELDTEANADDAEVQAEIADLEEERTRAAETIADLDGSIRTINGQLATLVSPLEVADQAIAAREPDSPRPLLMAALGLFLGFLLGCGLAAILEFADRKVRRETDVEAITDSRLLGILPMDRKAASTSEPLVLAQPDTQAAETIRMLRAHLNGFARSDDHGTIVVADAGGVDGASDLVANLGIVMAQSGLDTVIVDADLRNPRQHEIFGADNSTGLSDALTGTDLGATRSQEGPILITAGHTSEHPGKLIGSAAFGELIQGLRQEANLVLIDVPPALDYSDAMSAASVAEGVILVGRYNKTTRDDLAALAETLREDGVRLLGVVMISG